MSTTPPTDVSAAATAADAHTSDVLRRWILVILTVGIVGTTAELLLLGHYEELIQWLPIALLVASLAVAWAAALRPGTGTLRTLLAFGGACVLAGGLGVLLHYRGNAEFEREIYPTMAGFELVRESFTGATPALAPGSMVLLGLLMMAYTFRHPAGVAPTRR